MGFWRVLEGSGGGSEMEAEMGFWRVLEGSKMGVKWGQNLDQNFDRKWGRNLIENGVEI